MTNYASRMEAIEVQLKAALQAWEGGFGNLPAYTPGLGETLIQPCADIIRRGGKRWRPLLMTLVSEALAKESQKGFNAALPLTPLVEFAHNASLIHDDIEDRSDTRRGKPAIHISYGQDRAINSASFLYFLAQASIEQWEAPVSLKNAVFQAWGVSLRRLHLGQALDIEWHNRPVEDRMPDIRAYSLMCRMKTGSLAALATSIGLYTGLEATDSGLEQSLSEAAEKLGLGFQIIDDVKNLRSGNPGKKRGDDIVEGKRSLPVILYLQEKQGSAALLARCFKAAATQGIEAPEVEELISALETSGAITEAETEGRRRIAEAREAFAALPTSGSAKELLLDLPELISS
jgi:octaprenyl-diphosphate synthase